jgi:hypothetical protein
MPHNLVLLIVQIIAVLLIFQTLLSILKTVFSTVVLICVLAIVMTFFGFNSQDLFQKVIHLPQTIQELFAHFKKILGF